MRPSPPWEIAKEWLHLVAQDSLNTLNFNRLFLRRLPSPFKGGGVRSISEEKYTMSHYHQREIKDLYRPKDVILTVFGIIITMTIAVLVARLFTGYSGI